MKHHWIIGHYSFHPLFAFHGGFGHGGGVAGLGLILIVGAIGIAVIATSKKS